MTRTRVYDFAVHVVPLEWTNGMRWTMRVDLEPGGITPTMSRDLHAIRASGFSLLLGATEQCAHQILFQGTIKFYDKVPNDAGVSVVDTCSGRVYTFRLRELLTKLCQLRFINQARQNR